MSNKHTPGPWTAIENNYNGQYFIERRDSGYKSLIADCSNILGHGGSAKANAKLIAASPRLLAALIVARNDLVYLWPESFDDAAHEASWDARFAEIVAAIEAATS